MSPRSIASVVCALALCLGVSSVLEASPIAVSFTVSASPTDPVYGGERGAGTFMFDSSLVVPGGIVQNTTVGLDALSIAFNWAGGTWSAVNADVWGLQFNQAGSLVSFGIGGEPSLTTIPSSVFPDFMINGPFMLYSTPNGTFLGNMTGFSVDLDPDPQPQVPEPASLLLVGSGIAAVVGRRRVQRSRPT
jgi:hypothetical protein